MIGHPFLFVQVGPRFSGPPDHHDNSIPMQTSFFNAALS
jgi:hypothetical protein